MGNQKKIFILRFECVWPPLPWVWKFWWKPYFRRFSANYYIFIIDGLEPKLFDFKSSSQQQCCKAHKIGQLCHQDQASTCLCSKVRDRAMTAFQLTPKWQRGANGGFCKFGPFQPYLTHRQLDWSSMMFIESYFYGYLTCLVFAHVVWWWRALWTARTTRRTRPGSLLTWGCITSAEIFFNKDVMCCGDGGWHESFLFCQHVWPHLVHVSWWSTRPWTARTTWRRRPERSLILGCITWVRIFFN